MDPNATLDMFSAAIADDDGGAALEYGNTLAEWMENGGFPPSEFDSIAADLESARDDIFPHGGFARRQVYQESAALEFRLFIRHDGSLELATGDASYDTDHRGFHGAGSVSAVDTPDEIRDAVFSAFLDCLETLAQIL